MNNSLSLDFSKDSYNSKTLRLDAEFEIWPNNLKSAVKLESNLASTENESFESSAASISFMANLPWDIDFTTELRKEEIPQDYQARGWQLGLSKSFSQFRVSIDFGADRYELDNKKPIALFSEDPAIINRTYRSFSFDLQFLSDFFISVGESSSSYDRSLSGISAPAAAIFFPGSSISMITGLPKKERFLRLGWELRKNSFLLEAASSESEIDSELLRTLSFQYERLISRRWNLRALGAVSPALPTTENSNYIIGLGGTFKF